MHNHEKIILGGLFLLAIYFPIFLHLDQTGLYLWDEATNALQAYEMSQNGNYLRRFFLGSPDNWETKPPLLIWLQVICMKIFGYNELAVRLPSALAVLATLLLIFRFFQKELNFFAGGICSTLVLLCSSGYVRGHVSRTGDHDALLIFFLIAGLIYWYKYLKKTEQRTKYLALFTVAFIGGIMTKSIAGLFFTPGLLVFTILEKRFLGTLKDKKFWLAIGVFLVFIGGFYGLNEFYYPGYLEAVWDNELFPRFFNTSEIYDYNENPEPLYYLKLLIAEHFSWFYIFVLLSLLLIFFQKDQNLKRFMLLVALTALLFMFVISQGTVNSWYSAPVIPLLAMIVGAGAGLVYRAIRKQMNFSKTALNILYTLVFLVSIFYLPYKSIVLEQCYFPKLNAHDPKYGDFLKRLRKEYPDLKDFFVYYEPLNRHFLFYRNVYNDQYGYNINSCGPGNSIRNCKPKQQAIPGDHLMVCNKKLKAEVLKVFEVKELQNYQECKLYLVLSSKETEPDEQ